MRACSRNSSSPSLSEIELTIALALQALEPRLDARDHFERVDHDRHARDVGLGGRAGSGTCASPATESSIPSSMFTSRICAPPSTCWRATSSASSYCPAWIELREPGRARHVGALADVHEVGVGPERQRLEAARARVRRGPAGGTRGGSPRTASAIARMWSGVVPQQPPTMFSQPAARALAEVARHRLRRLVEAAEGVRQPGVRVAAHEAAARAATAPRRRPHLARRRARS